MRYNFPDRITPVKQLTPNGCGGAVIAMIGRTTFEKGCKLVGTRGLTSYSHLKKALDYMGIKYSDVRRYKSNPMSDTCIASLSWKGHKGSHWVLFFKGELFDPNAPHAKQLHPDVYITSFLTIYK